MEQKRRWVEHPLPAMRAAGLDGQDAFFSAAASSLSLPVKMGIRQGQCFGWLVSDEELPELGLTKLTGE